MAQQIINLGATGSGAGGDSARTAFEKAIANFAELYIAALPGTAEQKQAARDMFGLGTAATKAAQTSATDTTAGALMAVGAFGVGGMALDAGVSDLNQLVTPGRWRDDGWVMANRPPGFKFGEVIVGGYSPNYESQTYCTTDGRRAFRARDTGEWGAWREVFNTGNILGTVSQSAGVPTGAIIERGSNANGEYTRWADGTQICWAELKYLGIGAGIRTETWQFPATFALRPPAVSGHLRAYASVAKYIGNGTSTPITTTSAPTSVNSEHSGNGSLGASVIAIGRWF